MLSAIARRSSGLSKRRLVAVDEQMAVNAPGHHLTDRLRHLALYVLHDAGPSARTERSCRTCPETNAKARRRRVPDDRPLNAIEIRPVGFPVIWIAGYLDMISFGLNSTNLNGPVPIGWVRICDGGTWHG